ncbi:MAG: hypothetical protein EP344_03165 [Bacteroidetes bacterium]|nr:MAG: hypothetical protein EP344_03165 [Bacteroidota bacterium]
MLLDLMSWWEALGNAEQWFWAIALVSNVLFALYLVVQFAGGHDTDIDGDVDVGTDIEVHDGDTGFTILSLRSLLAFGMFMGYSGVVAMSLGTGWFVALLIGLAAGTLAAWLAYRLLRLVLRLQSSGTLDIQNSIGQTGQVYLPIPAQAGGMGKVMVEIQGAMRELDAVSESEAIPTGTEVLVVGLTDDDILIVQPFQALPGNQKIHQLISI